MRYLSLFSGIEAASVAWEPLGWECVGFAEVDPFASAVLAHRYPDVPNLGDVTAITDEQIADLGQIDLVVGGSPCQDLSVAGRQAGLAGSRSSLFFEQMRLFHVASDRCGARFLLWENVPGAFSTNGGQDFAAVVGVLAGAEFPVPKGRWQKTGVAVGANGLLEWRVLDAQYVRVQSHPRAVPQRRRRVFTLLDTGDWRDRPPVLLEPEGLRGHPPPRREAGQGAAGTLKACASSGGWSNSVDHAAAGLMIPAAFTQNQRDEVRTMDVAAALVAEPGMKQQTYVLMNSVRRLTPLECERLQGFPDSWTQVPYRNKPAADGPRYKALGNSMAVNCMRWIGERITFAAMLS